MKNQEPDLIRTKFYKPQLTPDYVKRDDLIDRLNQGAKKPLILISAPAGYGKSTLISSWLDHKCLNYGWISISEYDNNWLSFLRYFVFGLNNALPGKFDDTLSILNAPEIPDSKVIAHSILNQLVDLDEDFYLVLDDYHYLHDLEIHNLINTLLQFPAPFFHLIVITRVDPPFRIHQLRAKDLIIELRSRNLVFKINETTEFLRSTIDNSVTSEVCLSASKITDGWVTGLRLFSLNFRNKSNQIDEFLGASHGNLFEELVDEIFMEFSPEVQQFVLKSSVLHQFNTSICDEICKFSQHFSAADILNYLKVSNLFIIPIDEERGWYRFHHLFQDYLRRRFEKTYSNDEQERVHHAAAVWLRKQDKLKGAILHFTKSNDIEKAVEIFEIYRHQLMNESQWPEFSQALGLFDEQTAKAHIELLLAQAWFNIYTGKPFEMFALLEPIKTLINTSSLCTEKQIRYLAELNCLQPYKTYNIDLDFHEVIKQCDFALENLDEDQRYVKGYAWIFKLAALQAIGKYVEAKKLVAKNLEENSRSIIDSHLYLVMNYLQWVEADIEALFETSDLLIKSSVEGNKNMEAFANGNHFYGIGKYMIHELGSAKIHLAKSHDNRYNTVGIVNIMNTIALVILHLAQNNISEAERMIVEVKAELRKKRSYLFNTMLDAVHAEIYLSKNDVDKALNNLKEVEQIPLAPFTNFFLPQCTLVKALIYAEDTSSLARAKGLLKNYLEFAKEIHNKLAEMKFLALQSLHYYRQNELTLAFSSLQDVLDQTKTYRIIRVFLDCGSMMKNLLVKYRDSTNSDNYIDEIIQSFQESPDDIVLSTRELDVLPLFNLSNKEIAEQLFISEKTVKRHCNSIFKKLHVKNRREALHKAKELKLV